MCFSKIKPAFLFFIEKSKNINHLLLGISAAIAAWNIPEYKLTVEVVNKVEKQKTTISKMIDRIIIEESSGTMGYLEPYSNKAGALQPYSNKPGANIHENHFINNEKKELFIKDLKKIQEELYKD